MGTGRTRLYLLKEKTRNGRIGHGLISRDTNRFLWTRARQSSPLPPRGSSLPGKRDRLANYQSNKSEQ
jgi:hypothetical protein